MHTNNSTSIILAALRHWQRSVESGHDLSAYADIVDAGAWSVDDIDSLCERINAHARGQTEDVYQVVALSTAHLSDEDMAVLEQAAGQDMITKRDTGFFVKLYEEDYGGGRSANYRDSYSDTLKGIIRWAYGPPVR